VETGKGGVCSGTLVWVGWSSSAIKMLGFLGLDCGRLGCHSEESVFLPWGLGGSHCEFFEQHGDIVKIV